MATPLKDTFASLTERTVDKLTSLQKVVQQLCNPSISPLIGEEAVDIQPKGVPEL